MRNFFCGLLAILSWELSAKELLTNQFKVLDAPDWLSESLVDSASSRVQNYLEWDIRRITVRYHSNAEEFRRLGKVGPKVKAYYLKTDSTIHLGPEVTAKNFKPILSHEAVHVILAQKYGAAIPPWLEEGLANYVGSEERSDRKWLLSQNLPVVTSLRHPATDPFDSRLHYQLSTAAIEMLADKCDLKDLLALSVGRKLETHMRHLCEIEDVNKTFSEWLKKSASAKPRKRFK